ncbi:hypothetical protein [Herbaspirillum sp. C7C8]|uniref:hypothetical protein n=1 Tax=Herbaspirillum sp. C7C8 TaxID=2736665 RepID=UPI001F519B7A|nr:hypothetical protein [Herbaspirillum sp. C7C8]MCI1007003.1 hypothetical protein [Herbaspirillum sp. C7C8]
MSRTIGDGRDFWRPGNEDLPMLVERLCAQQEDRAWLSGPEHPDTVAAKVSQDCNAPGIALPQLTDAAYWNSALLLPPDWFNHASATASALRQERDRDQQDL